MNFAGTFPIWDLLFGTLYMPEHELFDTYGIDDRFPESFGALLLLSVLGGRRRVGAYPP